MIQIIGYAMIALPFLIIFILFTKWSGFKEAVTIFLFTIIIIGLVGAGTYLINQ